jgi:predicted nucleic acid-binding protein
LNRVRLYLDTSVISHLQAEDTPEKNQDTLDFWRQIKKGIYQVVISDLTLTELIHCPEPKRSDASPHSLIKASLGMRNSAASPSASSAGF